MSTSFFRSLSATRPPFTSQATSKKASSFYLSRAHNNAISLTRTMATSSTPKSFNFLVVVPDKPGTLAKRLEVRGTHFKDLSVRMDNEDHGGIRMGGALLNAVPESNDATTWDFAGSTLVCKAESKEAVLESLHNDIYAKSGVWDMEKVQVYPFQPAVWHP